jgi:hypothetical protein
MTSATLGRLPRRPDSEFEWEDLLVRLELMPRALRVALESGESDPTWATDVLIELAEREWTVGELLDRIAGGARASADASQVTVFQGDALERFVRLRARSFAMVQRRGLEVWDWETRLDDGSTATVHQLLTLLVREDVAALATIRRLTTSGTGMC